MFNFFRPSRAPSAADALSGRSEPVSDCVVLGCSFYVNGLCESARLAKLVSEGKLDWREGMELAKGCSRERK